MFTKAQVQAALANYTAIADGYKAAISTVKAAANSGAVDQVALATQIGVWHEIVHGEYLRVLLADSKPDNVTDESFSMVRDLILFYNAASAGQIITALIFCKDRNYI